MCRTAEMPEVWVAPLTCTGGVEVTESPDTVTPQHELMSKYCFICPEFKYLMADLGRSVGIMRVSIHRVDGTRSLSGSESDRY